MRTSWMILLVACGPGGEGPSRPDIVQVGPSDVGETDAADTEAGDDTDGSGDDTDAAQDDNDAANANPPRAIIGPAVGDFLPGDTILLDGSGSTDLDGDVLTFQWTIVAKPTGSAGMLSNATQPLAALYVDTHGEFTVQLTVDDGATTDTTTTQITVLTDNLPPVANAGIDQRVAQFATVQLNGNQSSDPNGDPLSYFWTFVSTPSVVPILNGASNPSTAASPTFVAPELGIYTLELKVSDGELDSLPDTVEITVFNPNP